MADELPFYDDDDVNHPSHYETNGVECIDAMEASQGTDIVKGHCLCNAFKYIWRCKHKGKEIEDIKKAVWYLNKYLDLSKKEDIPFDQQDFDIPPEIRDAMIERIIKNPNEYFPKP